MKVYDEMKALLVEQPLARERKNKYLAVRAVLKKKYPELENIDKYRLASIFRQVSTYDRAWRDVTSDHENLRGSDYGEKDKLEAEVQEALGYDINKNL